jgi:hypothetical protein
MTTPQTRQEAAPPYDKEYCETHDAYFDPLKDEWLESACSDPECWYCPGRPERPSLVVRKQQTET